MRSSGRIRLLAGVVLLGMIATAGALVPASAILGVAESTAADPVRFALVVTVLYLLRPFVALPTTPLAALVGYGYGVRQGVPIALVGVVVTVLPVFFAARWVVGRSTADDGTPPVTPRGRIGRLLKRTERVIRRYYETAGPTRGVTASRLAPIPSDVSTCAAAVSGVRLRHFAVGTLVGELPWTVAAVVVGASAATVTAGGVGDLGLALALACGLAAALLLAGPAHRALRARPGPDDSSRSVDG